MGGAAGPGVVASVYTDLLDGIKGAHGTDVVSKGALAFGALYRWAPRLASWLHQRRMMSPFIMGYILPNAMKACPHGVRFRRLHSVLGVKTFKFCACSTLPCIETPTQLL